MLGHTHAVTGMATATALLTLAPIDDVAGQLAWITVAAGWALAPDIDHPNATATRMWGPVTRLAHRLIARLARGHRAGTHDPLVAPLTAATLVWAAGLHPLAAAVPVAVSVGLGLRAMSWAIPGNHERAWAINLPISLTAGWWLTNHTNTDMTWLPLAAGLGVIVAIAGDALTPHGVVIPGSWITHQPRRTRGGPITTGRGVERLTLIAAYAVAAGCAYLHIDPITHTLDTLTGSAWNFLSSLTESATSERRAA